MPIMECSNWLRSRRHLYHTSEAKKVVVSTSLWKVLLRSHIHVWPIATSIAIIIINIDGRFIGVDFRSLIPYQTVNTLLLQITAKLHELLVVASLAAIVSHVVKTELVVGDGLPLGLINAATCFGSVTYFSSKDFRGSLRSVFRFGYRIRGLLVIATLLVSGAIALLVGPSSATLLVPKDSQWSSAATSYYIPGSWMPFNLTATLPEIKVFCDANNSTDLSICPAGGYLSLLEQFSRINATNFYDQITPAYSANLAGTRMHWPVHGRSLGMPSVTALGGPRMGQGLRDAALLLQPPAGPVMILQQLTTDWWRGLTSRMGNRIVKVKDRQVISRMYSPVTYVRCAPPQNLTRSDKLVTFPTIEGRFDFAKPMNVTVPMLDGIPRTRLRFQWFLLPDRLGAVSLGGVFESSWARDNSSRVVLGCSIQSGYVLTDVNTDQYSFWTGWYTSGVDWGSRIPAYTQTPEPSLEPTNGRVSFDYDWLNLLTPQLKSLPVTPEGPVSTIEHILDKAGVEPLPTPESAMTAAEEWQHLEVTANYTGPSKLLEFIIGSVVVDGLGRVNSYQVFNTTDSEKQWILDMYQPRPDFYFRLFSFQDAFQTPPGDTSTYNTLYAEMFISGLNYEKGLAVYLAMSVLLIHMLMVLMHLIRLSAEQRTSNSWNSATEMLALAQNSRPAWGNLKNTGGGIACSRTMGIVGKIRVRPNLNEPGTCDHLELIFEDDDEVEDAAYEQDGVENGFPMLSSSSSGSRDLHRPIVVDTDEAVQDLDAPGAQSTGTLVPHVWTWPNDSNVIPPTPRPNTWRSTSDQPLLVDSSQVAPASLAGVDARSHGGSGNVVLQPQSSNIDLQTARTSSFLRITNTNTNTTIARRPHKIRPSTSVHMNGRNDKVIPNKSYS